MTTTKTKIVEMRFHTLGKLDRKNASRMAFNLLVRVISKWMRAMRAPSNSVPRPVLMVVGEKAFQMMDSQMLVAMKREMPEPRP